MWTISSLKQGLALAALVLPAVCGAQLGLPAIPADRIAQLNAFATTDPEEQKRRWGPWVGLPGKLWVWETPAKFRDTRGHMNASAFELRWAVPGAAMHFTVYWCYPKDPCQERTGLAMYNGSEPWGLLGKKLQWFDVVMKDGGAAKGAYDKDTDSVWLHSGHDMTFRIKDGKVLHAGGDHRPATPDDLPMLARVGIEAPALRQELAKREEAESRAAAERSRLAAEEATRTKAAADAAWAQIQRERDDKRKQDEADGAKSRATGESSASRQAQLAGPGPAAPGARPAPSPTPSSQASLPHPLSELVGEWHGFHDNVIYELKPNGELVVVQNNSSSESLKRAGFTSGLVIARATDFKNPRPNRYVSTGECWTRGGGRPTFWLQPCTEAIAADYDTGPKKPYWKLYTGLAGMMVRKADLGYGGQGRK